MRFQYIQEAISLFENYTKGIDIKVIFCTEVEVAELEALLSSPYKLPAAYKEFLLYSGRKMADFFKCCDISYGTSKGLIEDGYQDIIDMLIGSGGEEDYLDPDVFVIAEHLGANMYYFKLTEGDNPPIYYWDEGEGGLEASTVYSDAFSNFLLRKIEAWYQVGDYKRKS